VIVVVNGRPHTLAENLSVAQLLAHLRLAERGTAVEMNGEIVPRNRYGEHRLRDGDRVEIVSLAGGG
jgi:sulfur carrier protein